jgi:drug/metabolite transporter (DMT)-like permease
MSRPQPARWLIVAAFAAVYFIWGSSYLGIRLATTTIPPFLMMGSRFALAGAFLMLGARLGGAPLPSGRQWLHAGIVGALLFLINNGILVWASQHMPSGVLALCVASVPMWFALLEWVLLHRRPSVGVIIGLLLGFGGLALLITPDRMVGGSDLAQIAGALVIFGTVAWAAGSLYSRRVDMPRSPAMSTGAQLLTGGVLLMALDLVTGEFQRFQVAGVTAQSFIAWTYLWVLGSVVAFSAYTFLLRNTPSTQASTYAFVNPVVALILGALFGGEALTSRTIIPAAIIVVAVALIILSREKPLPAHEAPLILSAADSAKR